MQEICLSFSVVQNQLIAMAFESDLTGKDTSQLVKVDVKNLLIGCSESLGE